MEKKLGIVSNKEEVTNAFQYPNAPCDSVVVMTDVPHLIKNLRNHIVNGQSIRIPPETVVQFRLPTDVVSVEPLQRLVEYQADKELKPAPKLTSKHLQPSHFEKMKVSQALNVFSHSVAARLRLMVETNGWDKMCAHHCLVS